MKTVLKNGMIDVYFKEEIEWDLEKIFYGVEQLLLINVKVLGKDVYKRQVDEFLQSQSEHLKGVVVSGDTGYGEAYCKAGDVIAEQYNVPCLYKVENDGSDEDIEAIKKVIA